MYEGWRKQLTEDTNIEHIPYGEAG